MKKLIYIFSGILLFASCLQMEQAKKSYDENLHSFRVGISLPSEGGNGAAEGIAVMVTDVYNAGGIYNALTDSEGVAAFTLPNGLYMVSVTYSANDELWSASKDRVRIAGSDRSISLSLAKVKTGDILIKEVYCGGCKKTPAEGNYMTDKYIILHNNINETIWLDGLCLGMYSPYNATGTSPWNKRDNATGATIFPDFVPVCEAVWQFGGDGNTFPLEPGEDAVIAVNGAIDHTAQYPLSVNLNKPDYFVCYNTTHFPNPSYHPAPGDKISQDRILDVVVKTGQSNAYPLSISSPAIVIFRAEGTTIREYLSEPDNLISIPGSSAGAKVSRIPYDWVIDAVEVFDGRSSNNSKRIVPQLDGGYVYQSDTYLGHSLLRRVNESKSSEMGYEVLVDTNNSSNDFFESPVQTLHTEKEVEDE